MSQKTRIVGTKAFGSIFLGTDTETDEDMFSSDGDTVLRWLSDAYRARFNQCRSTRSKYVYADGTQIRDAAGEPVLFPIGNTVDDLTHAQARTQYSFLAAAPAMVLHSAQREEMKSWFSGTKRRTTNIQAGRPSGRMPQFRSRKHSPATFSIFANNGASPVVSFQKTGRRTGIVSFGGMNPVGKTSAGAGRRWRIQLRVRVSQPINAFSSVQINADTRELIFISPVPLRPHAHSGAVVGIDLGIAVDVATSDGALLTRPNVAPLLAKRKKAQQAMNRSRSAAKADSRNFWESRRYQTNKATAASLSAKVVRIMTDWRHKTTSALVDGNDIIVIENLQVRNMTRSAAGTTKTPGKRVAQKRGLNRGMAAAAPSTIRSMLEYKTKAAGIELIAVPAHYTSQRCNKCEHIAAENRESQAVFICTECGHRSNADTNAAANTRDRGLGLWGQDMAPQVRKRQTTTGQP